MTNLGGTVPCGNEFMTAFRLYEEAERAIREHKWLESEKAGRDLGVEAEMEWIQTCWRPFYRSQYVRHMRGEAFFEEFGSDCFAVVSRRLAAFRHLSETMLELVQEGAENLDLIRWARDQGHPIEQVLSILMAMDINRRRLLPPPR